MKRHKAIYTDSRYDAVGSSSLREELFAAFLKSLAAGPSSSTPTTQPLNVAEPSTEASKEQQKKDRTEKALKEREQQARKEKAKVDRDIGRSRGNLSEERGVEEFMSLLTDGIREPTVMIFTHNHLSYHLTMFSTGSI